MPSPSESRDTSPARRDAEEHRGNSAGQRPRTGVTDFERHVRQLADQQPGFESASDRIAREYREQRQQPGFESASDRIAREYREQRQQPSFESASDRIAREYREQRQQPGFESASDRIAREYREQRQQQGQNLDNSYEGRLVAFATETLMDDPEKVFPDKGPKNSHEHEMVWAIVGELSGRSYPMYDYLRNHPRYPELKDWTLNEFHKWQEENAQS